MSSSIDSDWIKEFLNMSDEELDRVNKAKSVKGVADDDDDCVILDGDPETSVNGSPTVSSDDLVIVAEKGPIACRDYPHPRHLCANFPFSSTPHERYCAQCHCYACDSPAPCVKWGTGISSTDLCHATDTSKMWKILRESFKLGFKTAPLSASTNHNHSTLAGGVGSSHYSHFPPLNSTNYMPMNHISQQTKIPMLSPNNVPLCSTASNFIMLHDSMHNRCQASGSIKRYQSHSIPRQLLDMQNHAIQKAPTQGTRDLGPQFLNASMMSSSLGPQFPNQSTQPMNHIKGATGFSNHVNPAWQNDQFRAATGFSNRRTGYAKNDVLIPRANTSNNSSIQVNGALSSNYMAVLKRNQHLNVHQIGNQNENAHHGNIIQSGATMQQPPCGNLSEFARNVGFLALNSSWVQNTNQNIPHLQSFGSINMPVNAKEYGTTPFPEESTDLSDISNWLLDEPS